MRCESLRGCASATRAFPIVTSTPSFYSLLFPFFLPWSPGCGDPSSVLPACLHQPPPVLFPDSSSPGAQAVLLGKRHTHLLSQPCPVLRRGRGTPHREIGWEHEGAQAGGPPLVGETEWMFRQCPPLSCRLGRSREAPGLPAPVRLFKVAPSQVHHGGADSPHPQALHTVGPLP